MALLTKLKIKGNYKLAKVIFRDESEIRLHTNKIRYVSESLGARTIHVIQRRLYNSVSGV